MKADHIYLYKLRNEEHFEFGRDVIALVKKFTAAALKAAPQLAELEAANRREDALLEPIRKSALTRQIAETDHARDETFRGMAEAVLSATHHFDPKIRAAAERIQIVMQTYGDVARRNYAEQTGALENLLNEIVARHQADMELLNLEAWIQETDRLNVAVEKLLRDRDAENAARDGASMKQVRDEADQAYHALVRRVEALQEVEGAAAPVFGNFLRELNALIARYNDAVAVRRGRAAAGREKEERRAADEAGVDVGTWRQMQKAAAAAETAARRIAAASAKAVVVEQADATAVEAVKP